MANTKSEMIFIRVTEDEKALIKKTAEKDNRSMSDWCRLVLIEKLKEDAGE